MYNSIMSSCYLMEKPAQSFSTIYTQLDPLNQLRSRPSLVSLHKYSIIPFQMQSCIAIRNLVSRSDEHRSSFLELSAESLLRTAAAVDETVSEPAMAALRDLGCEVTLNEKWKGEGHQIEQ